MTEPRRRRRVILALSLVLNVFLVALIGGFVWRHRIHVVNPAGAPFGSPLNRALAAAEASLPRRDAAAFDAVIRREAPHFAQAGTQLLAARRAVGEAIIADPYDPQAVHQAFLAWQASWNQFANIFNGTLVEALAQVSPEGRRKLVIERGQMQDGYGYRGP